MRHCRHRGYQSAVHRDDAGRSWVHRPFRPIDHAVRPGLRLVAAQQRGHGIQSATGIPAHCMGNDQRGEPVYIYGCRCPGPRSVCLGAAETVFTAMVFAPGRPLRGRDGRWKIYSDRAHPGGRLSPAQVQPPSGRVQVHSRFHGNAAGDGGRCRCGASCCVAAARQSEAPHPRRRTGNTGHCQRFSDAAKIFRQLGVLPARWLSFRVDPPGARMVADDVLRDRRRQIANADGGDRVCRCLPCRCRHGGLDLPRSIPAGAQRVLRIRCRRPPDRR